MQPQGDEGGHTFSVAKGKRKNISENVLTFPFLCDTIVERDFESHSFGGLAQLARASGSYPAGRWFKSDIRYHSRLVGQAVKTRPFHGCNSGSIPLRVTNEKKTPGRRVSFFRWQLCRRAASHALAHRDCGSHFHRRRVKLACKRQGEKYSSMTKFRSSVSQRETHLRGANSAAPSLFTLYLKLLTHKTGVFTALPHNISFSIHCQIPPNCLQCAAYLREKLNTPRHLYINFVFCARSCLPSKIS